MTQYTVFFSWQSDLPNNKNRTFIEECLIKATKELKKDIDYHLDLNIDRDTLSKLGTPDITESIFDKIDKSSFFVADVSIINSKSRKYRKTPNPNVLTELGYAAKKLGWERIICVLNTEYGKVTDLPFDIRNRRILTYNFNDENKSIVKKNVINIFYDALMNNYKNTIFSNELIDYYNYDIYDILLTIISDFNKILFGYENRDSSLERLKQVLTMTKSDMNKILRESTFIGFQLFKSYDVVVNKLSKQLEKIVTLKNFDDEYYVPLVRLIHILKIHDKELNRRINLSTLNDLHKTNSNFKIITNNSNHDLPNRIILLNLIEGDKGVVTDFGDIIKKDHIAKLTNEFMLPLEVVPFYQNFICASIHEINTWIDNNQGDFLIDISKVELYGKKP